MTELFDRESQTVEFKQSLGERKEIIETVVAFANSNGGVIWVGVKNNGEVVGLDIGIDTQERLVKQIQSDIFPPIYPSVEIRRVLHKNVIQITVPKGGAPPYFARGRGYIRVGPTNQQLSPQQLQQYFLDKVRGLFKFDAETNNDFSIKHIKEETVRWYLNRRTDVRSTFHNVDDAKLPLKDALVKIGVMINGKINNAGILMFATDPRIYIPNSEIRCVKFNDEKGAQVADLKTIQGPVPQMYEETRKFLVRHLTVGDRWEYPWDALKEAVINALAHRDYTSPGSIQLSIYSNRIEIWSPGTLIDVLSFADLRKRHPSLPRNGILANLLSDIRLMEKIGEGTTRIIHLCLKNKLPSPSFQHKYGGFLLRIWKYRRIRRNR